MPGLPAPQGDIRPRFVEVEVTFQNYGRTPANIAVAAIFCDILNHIPTDADVPNIDIPAMKSSIEIIIGADREWTTPKIASINQFTMATSLAVTVGDLDVYCWGNIQYRDIFGDTHPTTFCRRLEGSGGWVPVGTPEQNRGT